MPSWGWIDHTLSMFVGFLRDGCLLTCSKSVIRVVARSFAAFAASFILGPQESAFPAVTRIIQLVTVHRTPSLTGRG